MRHNTSQQQQQQQDDEFCCAKRLIDKSAKRRDSGNKEPAQSLRVKGSPLVHTTMKYYQHLINNMSRKLYSPRHTTTSGHRWSSPQNSVSSHQKSQSHETTKTMLLIVLVATLTLTAIPQDTYASGVHHQNHYARLKGAAALEQLPAQARVGGLDPSDYIDEAGELDVLINQQQIPTAQLMQAAGYNVPDNFFLPGGSIPAASLYAAQQARYLQQQQQHQLQQQQLQQQQLHQQQQAQSQQQPDAMQQAASQVQARVVPAPARYHQNPRALELLMAAAEQQQQQHSQESVAAAASHPGAVNQLIDFNGYSLTSQPDPRDAGPQMDLAEFLNGPQASNQQQQHTAASMLAMYERELLAAQHQHQHHQLQQHQQQQYQHQSEHGNMVDHMAAMASNQQQQQEQTGESEHYQLASGSSAAMVGPDYQLIGSGSGQEYPSNNYESGKSSPLDQQMGASSHQHQHNQQQQGRNNNNNNNNKPFGLPTKSSDKEPPGMLKPMGNPKTISSPLIDFAANNLPKNTGLEKLAEKLPQHQTPTVFSFASSKDPSEKVKAVNQKKRNVMRQAEQIARLMIKSFNDKFGTNLGDQTDIPFLLSTLGPLGFAQNVLFDPTLLVSLLNTAEKTYFSDVLPAPAKQVIKPVLNIFRVPNKKRDKANLLNIISYVTSGGQTSSSVPSKHRQSFGIEKSSNKNNKHNR